MAQSKNTVVGCATKICKGGPFVVCNYDAPNMLDKPIYKAGKTCSACENGRKCSNSLCSTCVKKGAAGKVAPKAGKAVHKPQKIAKKH